MLDVHAWSFACPHSLSFFTPVSAFEKDVSHSLSSIAARALARIGLVDGMQIRRQAELASTQLGDDRADRSMGAQMSGQGSFSGSDPQSKESPDRAWPIPNSGPIHPAWPGE